MNFIKDAKDGDKLDGIYLVKERKLAQTKSGNDYYIVTLADKTGTLDCRIWDLFNIAPFEKLDYVEVKGTISSYNGALQGSIKWLVVVEVSDTSDYLPTSPHSISKMQESVLTYIGSIKNEYLQKLLKRMILENIDAFSVNSAASSVHHAFVGGLIQHSLEVAATCNSLCKIYPILNRDLLISAALLHDIGKLREFTPFPENAYSDEGNLLGHIYMGAEMISEEIGKIEGFPLDLETQLKHCILAHHGELEWGSPKKPALIEAVALSMADNLSAKIEAFSELLETPPEENEWYGFQRTFDSRLRRTTV